MKKILIMSMFLSVQLLQVPQIMAQEENLRESDLFYSFGSPEEEKLREKDFVSKEEESDDDLFYSFGKQEEEKPREKDLISGEESDDDLFYSFEKQEEEKPREKDFTSEESFDELSDEALQELGIAIYTLAERDYEKVLEDIISGHASDLKNLDSSDIKTALLYAAENGNYKIAKLLLSNSYVSNKTRNEALKVAQENNHEDIARLLDKYQFASNAKCIIC